MPANLQTAGQTRKMDDHHDDGGSMEIGDDYGARAHLLTNTEFTEPALRSLEPALGQRQN
eukprot:scaffold783_cov23-Cyclotella_meneghiniana.AAC.11